MRRSEAYCTFLRTRSLTTYERQRDEIKNVLNIISKTEGFIKGLATRRTNNEDNVTGDNEGTGIKRAWTSEGKSVDNIGTQNASKDHLLDLH
jgi:hypothetical protein